MWVSLFRRKRESWSARKSILPSSLPESVRPQLLENGFAVKLRHVPRVRYVVQIKLYVHRHRRISPHLVLERSLPK